MTCPKTSNKRIYKPSSARRNEILESAARMFESKGFSATKIQDIADDLGISYGAFYYHFKSKEDLLITFLKAQVENEISQMRKWRKAKDYSPKKSLYRFLRQSTSIHLTRRRIDRSNHDDPKDGRVSDAIVTALMPDLISEFEHILIDGNRTGDFNVPDPRSVSVLVFLMGSHMVHRSFALDKLVNWKRLDKVALQSVCRMVGLKEEIDFGD